VKPIAVSRFDQENVCLGHRRGIGEDGTSVAAEIAAEQNGFVSDSDASVSGSEQVPGVDELDFDPRHARDNRYGTVVTDRLQPIERARGINRRVERFRRDVLE